VDDLADGLVREKIWLKQTTEGLQGTFTNTTKKRSTRN
jgi:hypothetical protein